MVQSWFVKIAIQSSNPVISLNHSLITDQSSRISQYNQSLLKIAVLSWKSSQYSNHCKKTNHSVFIYHIVQSSLSN